MVDQLLFSMQQFFDSYASCATGRESLPVEIDDKERALVDKLAPYRGKVGLDLMDVLSRDDRLRPMLIDGKCYLSLVNLMEVFGDVEGTKYSPREFWRDEKRRLKKRRPQLWEKFSQLKLRAKDGKLRETDVAPLETCFQVLLYMNTPSSDEFKDLAGRVMARVSEAMFAYRAMNITKNMEWAGDTIQASHEEDGYVYPEDDSSAWEDLGYTR